MSLLYFTALFNLKQLILSRFYLLLAVVQPVFFAVLTGVLSEGDSKAHVQSLAGCATMGMWSIVLFGAGRALLRERKFGTLEHLLVSPAGLFPPVLGVCLAAALLGALPLTSVFLTVVAMGFVPSWQAVLVVVAVFPVIVLGLVALGVLVCALFVLSRQAVALSNALEYPVWFCCGLLVPVAVLPSWAVWIGAVLTPTYIQRILQGALAEDRFDWQNIAILLGIAVVELVLGAAVFRRVSARVRVKGDLSFA